MELTKESYKLLSYDDIKMDIINHYRKHQFLYDCRNSDYINRDLWKHTQRQFVDNLKCDGYADRHHTSNSTELLMQSWAKYISAIGTNLQRTILLNELVYDYKMECHELE